MVGLVLVTHSKKLAEALRELVLHWTSPHFPIAVASGVGENHEELGTDAVHIAEVLRPFCEGDGAVVLMDMGSAVLSAEVALELLDPVHREKVRLCAAPLVEGSFAKDMAGTRMNPAMDKAVTSFMLILRILHVNSPYPL